MTIAIGARCEDGVILMADRQISKEGGLKYYEKKVRRIEGNGRWSISFAYAGYPEIAKLVIGEVEDRLPPLNDPKTPTGAEIKSTLQKVLDEVWKKHKHKMQLELLCAPFVAGENHPLWVTKGRVVHQDDLQCLGIGDSSVVRYLADTLLGRHLRLSTLLPIGIYILDTAKKYIEGCGGKTDVLYVAQRHTGAVQEGVRFIERELKLAEYYVVNLIQATTDPRIDNEKFSKDAAGIIRKIERMRIKSDTFALSGFGMR